MLKNKNRVKSVLYAVSKQILKEESDPVGIRTQDPNIKSVVLYQLSYGINQTKLNSFLGVQK